MPDQSIGPALTSALGRVGKIIIAVTVPIITIGALILAFLLYRRWKQARSGGHDPPVLELDAGVYHLPAEMGSGTVKHGVDPGVVRYELPTLLPQAYDRGGVQSFAETGSEVNTQSLVHLEHPRELAWDAITQAPVVDGNHGGVASGHRNGEEAQPHTGQVIPDDDELRWLQEEEVRLNERQERLRKLEELEEQKELVRKRIQERRGELELRRGL